MVRQVENLSAKFVEKQKRPGYYFDGAGLDLQGSPTESKSWILRYTRFQKTREMGPGSLQAISLAEARDTARQYRKVLTEGKDPIEVRDAQKTESRRKSSNTISFAECAKNYFAAHRSGWRNPKHIAQRENSLETYAGPVIGNLPVSDVDSARVLRILEPSSPEKPETAIRVRGRIEHVLDWAKVRGYRSGDNPARWRGRLDLAKLLPNRSKVQRVTHLAALPHEQMNGFIEATGSTGNRCQGTGAGHPHRSARGGGTVCEARGVRLG